MGGGYQIYMGAKYIKGHHDQDFATCGSGENFHYVIVADGHGPRGNVVKLLKEIDWKGLLSCYHDDDELLDQINSCIEAAKISDIRDGSTLSIVKILPTEGKIHAYWIGDSQLVIRKTNIINSNLNQKQQRQQQKKAHTNPDQDFDDDNDENSMHIETLETTESESSRVFNTNPSSDFLIGEGGQLDDDDDTDDQRYDDPTTTNNDGPYNNSNDNKLVSPTVALIKPEMHNKNNKAEIERLRANNVRTENSRAPLVLSPTDITMVESLYFNHQIHGQTAKVNLTRSLGHCIQRKQPFPYTAFSSNGSIENEDNFVYATLQKFDTLSTDFDPMKDNVEVLVASDGFWDMVADDEVHGLLNEMESSWRKKQQKNEEKNSLLFNEETLNQQEGLIGIEDDIQKNEIILNEDEVETDTIDKKKNMFVHQTKGEAIKGKEITNIDEYKADASELQSEERVEDFYVQFANNRWKQMWNYQYKNFPTQQTKFEEGDDIGVAVFSSYVLAKPN